MRTDTNAAIASMAIAASIISANAFAVMANLLIFDIMEP
jgi:hypothetical protein